MKDAFGTYHPIINFLYFCLVIAFGMLFLNPLLLGISAVAALSYALYLKGRRALKFYACFLPLIMLGSVILNPLFNHQGVTIIGYLRDNPVTAESIIYGAVTGLMFAAIILWFSCYNQVMTSDKFIYLFGRIIPSISLIFSMVLRFVPKFIAQVKVISNTQKCVGRDVSNGRFIEKAGHGMRILSMMITWALENSLDTADSMKSRGYGLGKRTAFSLFRFDLRDKAMLGLLLALAAIVIAGGILGQNSCQYFPMIVWAETTLFSPVVYTAYFLLCFLPMILNIEESVRWKRLQSRI